MSEEEYEEGTQRPEELPEAGINAYDLIRILMMPVLGLAQGVSGMFEHLTLLFMHQSRLHDKRKADKQLEKLLG